ncbi:type II and III secretion system protein [Sphingobium chlorophenolicum L-1]|uniref:Type II and III secretion system protein n=1 Tax=Sphingobium chlorophenolicum L-1 TaxID=690566 RepID=F6F314_SPHCR|nr:type II and III secretion system protein [Sphingobium chlorophenolicum L-1]
MRVSRFLGVLRPAIGHGLASRDPSLGWDDVAYSLIVLALALPFAAGAETGLRVKEQRMLSYPRAIGRVEVDREGVLSVAAPSPRSLRLTAIGAGEATVSVFGGDGGLIGREAVRVAPADAPVVRAGEQVVAVDVQFAAVSATTLKALGFNFSKLSGDIQGAIVSPSSLGSASFDPGGLSLEASAPIQNAFNLFLSAPNRGIGAVLSALSSNGLSQLLAQPTLLVRSGEQASFLAGGEFPVPVPQASGSGNMLSIQYKEFGVRLSVTPFVLSKDHIVLKIAPEVSELDYANGVQLQGYVVPGLRRRSAETTVELGSGQSFVIAGLSYSSQTVTKEKTPFLGDLPVLGAFFKRQQNQKEKQELIIVATPRLVTAVKPEEVPPLPGVAVDPGISDMILGTDGLDQASAPLGVVRR